MPIEFNEKETKRFGIRCARVVDCSSAPHEIEIAARSNDIVFLSVRVPTDDIGRIQDLEANGFRLMDTLVVYGVRLHRAQFQNDSVPDVQFRTATTGDADAVAAVAAEGFAGFFGHFHADRRLSKTDADAVYVDWARSSVMFANPDLPVLVAEVGGEIIGFLASRKRTGGLVEIELNAVRPRYQGKGVYGALLDAALQRQHSAGFVKTEISTQLNNLAVQKAWVRRGLRMQRSFYTLHRWLDAPTT